MVNKVNKLLGTRYPILSAPMGGVAGGQLAAAVSNSGGAGLVGVSYGNEEFIDSELPIAARSRGVWGAGLVMFTFDKAPHLLDSVLSHRPPLVALSFGNAAQTNKYVAAIQRENLLAAVQVHDTDRAQEAAAAGADVIIAQGSEAGGHHKDRATFPLIPAVADALNGQIPLVAAGGIADGRGLAAALALGADGVMIGTRFAAAAEALTSPSFTDSLINGHSRDLLDTRAFDIIRSIPWPPQYTARALGNDFSRTWFGHEDELADHAATLVDAWSQSVSDDDVTQRPLFAGENIDLITSVQPAAQIIESMITQACSVLDALGTTEFRNALPAH